MALYGYVELRREARDSCPVIFNPEVDMLYINKCVDWSDLERAFICCGITDRLRILALKVENGSRLWFPSCRPPVFNRLQNFKSLELLFVVRKEEQQSSDCKNQWDLKFSNMDPKENQVQPQLRTTLFDARPFGIHSVNVTLTKYHNVDGYGWDM